MECNGLKISELEERVNLTGNEYLVFQDGDSNGKMNITALSKELNENMQFDATASTTSGETAKAEVTLANNTFNFKFQLPKGDKGQDGSTGVSLASRSVNAYKISEVIPQTPTGGYWNSTDNVITYPDGWSGNIAQSGVVWLSQNIFFNDGTQQGWTEPIRITGKDGENGVDGNIYEYIYTRTKTETPVPVTPVSSQTSEVPTGWFDNPQGITEEYRVEWVSIRIKNGSTWGDYSTPTIWSRWGENGKDGDGVEYCFTRTKENQTPARPIDSPQEDGYIPQQGTNESPWTNDPQGVSEVWRYEWVIVRRQSSTESSNAQWGEWSNPALWAYYSKDGITPNWKTYWFCQKDAQPAKPNNYNPYAPPSEDGSVWVDTIGTGDSWWEVIGSVDGANDLVTEWSEVFPVNGISYQNVTVFKSTGQSTAMPDKPVGGHWNAATNEITYPDGWTPANTYEGVVWMSNGIFISTNGELLNEWSTPVRITGETGQAGVDGLSIEFIYKLVQDEEVVVSKPDSQNTDGYIPSGWNNHPSGISSINRVEYATQRTKKDGTWIEWIDPFIWSRWGENGLDGDGVEYIYVRTNANKKPTRPTTSEQVDDYTPPKNVNDTQCEGNWLDDAKGVVSETWRWEWCCSRKSKNGVWGAFSEPALWAAYGEDGDSIEMRFRRSTSSSTAPSCDRSSRNPSGWTIDVPASGGDFVWQIFARINRYDELIGEWSAPICVTGERGPQGETGPSGQRGPIGPQGISGIPGVDLELRYSLGTETSHDATWNSTVKTTLDPTSYGWTLTAPTTTEHKPKVWFIQARIGHRSTSDTQLQYDNFLEDGEWTDPQLMGADGATGAKGDKGQIVYPMGVFKSDVQYSSDKYKTPYVYDPTDGNYYFMNWISSGWTGDNQPENINTPSKSYAVNQGSFWMLMEGYDAIFANVGVIANGLIGSAVFNGDYMFSQQGIDSTGAPSTHYENFNTDNPMNESNEFRPNICINMNTGEVWFAHGNVNFKTDGSGSLAQGNISWDSDGNLSSNYFKQNEYVVDSSVDIVHLKDIKQNVIVFKGDFVKLVLDNSQFGREFTLTSNVVGGTLVLLVYSLNGSITYSTRILATDGATSSSLYISNASRFSFRMGARVGLIFDSLTHTGENTFVLESLDGKCTNLIARISCNMVNCDLRGSDNGVQKLNKACNIYCPYCSVSASMTYSASHATGYNTVTLEFTFNENVLGRVGGGIESMFLYDYTSTNSNGITVVVNGCIYRGQLNGAGSGWTQSPSNAFYEKDPVKYEFSISEYDPHTLTLNMLNLSSTDVESMFNGVIEIYGNKPLMILS